KRHIESEKHPQHEQGIDRESSTERVQSEQRREPQHDGTGTPERSIRCNRRSGDASVLHTAIKHENGDGENTINKKPGTERVDEVPTEAVRDRFGNAAQ